MPTSTPNMGLQTPTAGESDYPTSISNSNAAVDQHDHTSGKGVQIPTGGIANLAVTTAKIAANALTADATGRGKMADGFVTRAKIEAVGQQNSFDRGLSFATTSTSLVDVTDLNATITTTGRPVIVGVKRGGTGAGFGISVESSAQQVLAEIAILRGATVVYRELYALKQNYSGATSGTAVLSLPSAFTLLDAPGAGSHTYKMQVGLSFSGTGIMIVAADVNIYAYEL